MTEELRDDQPGFWNDCKAWGNWMAEREEDPKVLELVKSHGCGALLTSITDGVDEDDVDWVTPEALAQSATRLRKLVLDRHPGTTPILRSYEKNANRCDPVEQEFARDLEDVAAIAEFFKAQGVEEMTLEVNW
jgi:hypothetical protein